jgi:hypothetical protein
VNERIPVTVVPGTHGWAPKDLKAQWYQEGSLWRALMDSEGFDVDTFIWSTNLDGFWPWRKRATWHAAGLHLRDRIVPPRAPTMRIPPLWTHVITHSHGLQPALIAAANGLYIHTLVDICGPVRADIIQEYGEAARKNIGYWIHLHSDGSDSMQWLGGLGDGFFGVRRPHPLVGSAGCNHHLPDAGHSGVLHDAKWFAPWSWILDTIRKHHGIQY